ADTDAVVCAENSRRRIGEHGGAEGSLLEEGATSLIGHGSSGLGVRDQRLVFNRSSSPQGLKPKSLSDLVAALKRRSSTKTFCGGGGGAPFLKKQGDKTSAFFPSFFFSSP